MLKYQRHLWSCIVIFYYVNIVNSSDSIYFFFPTENVPQLSGEVLPFQIVSSSPNNSGILRVCAEMNLRQYSFTEI